MGLYTCSFDVKVYGLAIHLPENREKNKREKEGTKRRPTFASSYREGIFYTFLLYAYYTYIHSFISCGRYSFYLFRPLSFFPQAIAESKMLPCISDESLEGCSLATERLFYIRPLFPPSSLSRSSLASKTILLAQILLTHILYFPGI